MNSHHIWSSQVSQQLPCIVNTQIQTTYSANKRTLHKRSVHRVITHRLRTVNTHWHSQKKITNNTQVVRRKLTHHQHTTQSKFCLPSVKTVYDGTKASRNHFHRINSFVNNITMVKPQCISRSQLALQVSSRSIKNFKLTDNKNTIKIPSKSRKPHIQPNIPAAEQL